MGLRTQYREFVLGVVIEDHRDKKGEESGRKPGESTV